MAGKVLGKCLVHSDSIADKHQEENRACIKSAAIDGKPSSTSRLFRSPHLNVGDQIKFRDDLGSLPYASRAAKLRACPKA
jgi:hypothetical protein